MFRWQDGWDVGDSWLENIRWLRCREFLSGKHTMVEISGIPEWKTYDGWDIGNSWVENIRWLRYREFLIRKHTRWEATDKAEETCCGYGGEAIDGVVVFCSLANQFNWFGSFKIVMTLHNDNFVELYGEDCVIVCLCVSVWSQKGRDSTPWLLQAPLLCGMSVRICLSLAVFVCLFLYDIESIHLGCGKLPLSVEHPVSSCGTGEEWQGHLKHFKLEDCSFQMHLC